MNDERKPTGTKSLESCNNHKMKTSYLLSTIAHTPVGNQSAARFGPFEWPPTSLDLYMKTCETV